MEVEMIDLENVLENVKLWVKEVGTMQIENISRSNLLINKKSSAVDLVTEVDELSEDMLINNIKKHYPDHSILSEESGEKNLNSDYLWIIDPVDGTTNYAQGLPIFAISICLKYKNEAVLGVVYAPMLNEMFYGIKGKGSYLNNKKLIVSTKENLNECVLATGFPYDRATNKDNNANYFSHFVPRVRGLRRMGAASYDLVSVAAGRLDGYWEMYLKIWDIAAGLLILEEAGGVYEYIPNKKEYSIVVGNKTIVSKILEEINVVNLKDY